MKKTNVDFGMVHIKNFTKSDGLLDECDPSTVVLKPNKTYTLILDYPVSTHYKAPIVTGEDGMTRIDLANQICKHYRKMYKEEDESTEIPAKLGIEGANVPMLNRCRTNGKYGIWGHCIGDLVLCCADIHPNGNIEVGVDS